MYRTDWPTYLSLEQREQLFAGKIARAVAASKLAEPKNIARHVANQSITNPAGLRRSHTNKQHS